jgi:hypothetical protein
LHLDCHVERAANSHCTPKPDTVFGISGTLKTKGFVLADSAPPLVAAVAAHVCDPPKKSPAIVCQVTLGTGTIFVATVAPSQ